MTDSDTKVIRAIMNTSTIYIRHMYATLKGTLTNLVILVFIDYTYTHTNISVAKGATYAPI